MRILQNNNIVISQYSPAHYKPWALLLKVKQYLKITRKSHWTKLYRTISKHITEELPPMKFYTPCPSLTRDISKGVSGWSQDQQLRFSPQTRTSDVRKRNSLIREGDIQKGSPFLRSPISMRLVETIRDWIRDGGIALHCHFRGNTRADYESNNRQTPGIRERPLKRKLMPLSSFLKSPKAKQNQNKKIKGFYRIYGDSRTYPGMRKRYFPVGSFRKDEGFPLLLCKLSRRSPEFPFYSYYTKFV